MKEKNGAVQKEKTVVLTWKPVKKKSKGGT